MLRATRIDKNDPAVDDELRVGKSLHSSFVVYVPM